MTHRNEFDNMSSVVLSCAVHSANICHLHFVASSAEHEFWTNKLPQHGPCASTKWLDDPKTMRMHIDAPSFFHSLRTTHKQTITDDITTQLNTRPHDCTSIHHNPCCSHAVRRNAQNTIFVGTSFGFCMTGQDDATIVIDLKQNKH